MKNDLLGLKFTRLLVISESPKRLHKKVYWFCLCDCGKETEVAGNSLLTGRSKSCGCLQRDTVTKHGKHKSREYRIWQQIKQRTTSRTDVKSLCYRERDIKVCEEWFNSFEQFYKDMGESNGLSIDRIDNTKGYYKENCKWATPLEQVKNRSCTIWITYKDITKTLGDWCRELNIDYNWAHKNYKYRNWTIEEIFENGVSK